MTTRSPDYREMGLAASGSISTHRPAQPPRPAPPPDHKAYLTSVPGRMNKAVADLGDIMVELTRIAAIDASAAERAMALHEAVGKANKVVVEQLLSITK